MSPASWEGDTWPHKSATGLLKQNALKVVSPIRGKQTSPSKKALGHANPQPVERTYLTLTLTQS
jgi:hypothetical protein